ncbi:MAG TPA: hypothetical protein VFV57_01165 [Limnobacter sp.]|nr:hypothetical protein [Limnobacter sp.]
MAVAKGLGPVVLQGASNKAKGLGPGVLQGASNKAKGHGPGDVEVQVAPQSSVE